ncbi:glycosyltransferase family 4 protein [Granulosicoccus antarcticus]|uniref:D-inositol-3-phosphate glycosyltransferase n=1 Tax=Granulosicoccus antarcticus IMCC3135 TaxID=1192854 RepID=A0A2Z2NSH7_9GAMM|nr:glycosyltransferase family 4 protein [Granulosicoccus antarcticus]ASJ74506.1 D-inositol-3-phosphate glycosyltransferase [Granulosicoccus antarcticus IMCC3135]
MKSHKQITSDASWSSCAQRVVIFVDDYLDFDGRYSIGGRQRFTRDLALLIRAWGREVVIVQKARKGFELECPAGISVIGLPAALRVRGDLLFWKKAQVVARPGDVFLYASGDEVWPFFLPNAKAIQHGISWDGDQKAWFRSLQGFRALGMARKVRSILCVDTNYINWLRCQGNEGYRLTSKCEYIPNYADLQHVPISEKSSEEPMAIISARRNSEFRGLDLFIEALGMLQAQSINFTAHISTNQGHDDLQARARELGFADRLTTSMDSMDEVLARYRDFDVAVIPTRWSEGTSLACVEALTAGLAVVTTPVGGLANLVIPGFNGYVVPPVAERIAESLAELDSTSKRQQMRVNALSMRPALGIDAWQASVQKWLEA